MISPELHEWIRMQSERLERHFPSATQREEILARLAKLTEECGELADEVLAFDGHQRKEKLANKEVDTLGKEFADVIITALLLAEKMGVDVAASLQKKVTLINERFDRMEQ